MTSLDTTLARKQTAMTNLRKANDEQQERQRWQASQTAREQPTIDPRSMLYVLQALIEAGEVDEARARYAAYKAEQETK